MSNKILGGFTSLCKRPCWCIQPKADATPFATALIATGSNLPSTFPKDCPKRSITNQSRNFPPFFGSRITSKP